MQRNDLRKCIFDAYQIYHMRYLVLAPLLFISLIAFGKDQDAKLNCKQFRNGKFLLDDSVSGKTIIERKGSVQTETIEARGEKVELHVEWISECSYTLKLSRILKGPTLIMSDLEKELILTVEIVETSHDSYIQTTTANISDMRLTNKIVRLK